MLIVGQVSLAIILLCVIKNSIYLKFSTWISVVIWILLLAISNIYFHIPSRRQTTDDVAVTFFLIFMCHVMLPMSKMLSLCFGGMTVVLQITTSGILSPKENMVAEVISHLFIEFVSFHSRMDCKLSAVTFKWYRNQQSIKWYRSYILSVHAYKF